MIKWLCERYILELPSKKSKLEVVYALGEQRPVVHKNYVKTNAHFLAERILTDYSFILKIKISEREYPPFSHRKKIMHNSSS